MKKYFLDTNIVIDLLAERYLNQTAIDIYLPQIPSRNLYMSTLSLHIIYYSLKIKKGSVIEKKLKTLLSEITLIPLTRAITSVAIETDFKDFEDLLQYFSAINLCDYLITRNAKDFKKIKAISPSKIEIVTDMRKIKELR